jgi:hypothetical protein
MLFKRYLASKVFYLSVCQNVILKVNFFSFIKYVILHESSLSKLHERGMKNVKIEKLSLWGFIGKYR